MVVRSEYATIKVAGLGCSLWLPVDESDFVAFFEEGDGCRDSNNAYHHILRWIPAPTITTCSSRCRICDTKYIDLVVLLASYFKDYVSIEVMLFKVIIDMKFRGTFSYKST